MVISKAFVSHRRITSTDAGTDISAGWNSEAQEAITEARATAATVHRLQGRIRELAAEASRTRAALPAAGRSDRPVLERHLRQVNREKRELVTALDAARRNAEHHTELLASPHPDAGRMSDDHPGEYRTAPRSMQHPNGRPTAPAHLLERLDELTTERSRRNTLAPQEHQREKTHGSEHHFEHSHTLPLPPPTSSLPEPKFPAATDLRP